MDGQKMLSRVTKLMLLVEVIDEAKQVQVLGELSGHRQEDLIFLQPRRRSQPLAGHMEMNEKNFEAINIASACCSLFTCA